MFKAGVYDLGDLKVASPPHSSPSPLCSVQHHAPDPSELCLALLSEPPTNTPPPTEERAGRPQTAREF